MGDEGIMKKGMMVAAAALLAAGTAFAQPTQVQRVRGTVEKADEHTLTVKSRTGSTIEIALAPNVTVNQVIKASLADVKPGKFVGIAGTPQPDGSQKALEVVIFPEAARGTGEGHYAWDLQPSSTMTNANVAEEVAQADGPMLTLKHKDGETKIFVPKEAPVVTFEPGDRANLKPGAAVFVPAQKAADGKLTAARVLVGKDGLVPPM
jgi:hypothetical protein